MLTATTIITMTSETTLSTWQSETRGHRWRRVSRMGVLTSESCERGSTNNQDLRQRDNAGMRKKMMMK
jgi:hypothetical protein